MRKLPDVAGRDFVRPPFNEMFSKPSNLWLALERDVPWFQQGILNKWYDMIRDCKNALFAGKGAKSPSMYLMRKNPWQESRLCKSYCMQISLLNDLELSTTVLSCSAASSIYSTSLIWAIPLGQSPDFGQTEDRVDLKKIWFLRLLDQWVAHLELVKKKSIKWKWQDCRPWKRHETVSWQKLSCICWRYKCASTNRMCNLPSSIEGVTFVLLLKRWREVSRFCPTQYNTARFELLTLAPIQQGDRFQAHIFFWFGAFKSPWSKQKKLVA